ncbi:Na-translocating system protein MpsC family protein [Priestia megaterium]|uniref:DUF2294 domain-containing protein n=1 Tax=Priestia megaterium TaxID=1404 RepID=UPI002FFDAC7A
MDIKAQQTKLANNLGKLLRDNFGKGPEAVHVTIYEPYVVIYVSGFVSPMEQVLLNQNEELQVMTTRELLVKTLEPQITGQIKGITDLDIQHLYYDWNLELQSGMFTMIHSDKENIANHSYKNQKLLHKEVEEVTQKAEKFPHDVSSYLLDQRTLLIIREGIMVSIEKELVQLGFEENLTLAKRNLEKRLLYEHSQSLEIILDSKVTDILVAWDFHKDKSTILLILNPTS